MYLCKKETIERYRHCPVEVIRLGFMKYVAVVHGRSKAVIAKGLRLRKYYNPYIEGQPGSGGLPGRICQDIGYWDTGKQQWVKGDMHYELRLEDPKNLNNFDGVCIWK